MVPHAFCQKHDSIKYVIPNFGELCICMSEIYATGQLAKKLVLVAFSYKNAILSLL